MKRISLQAKRGFATLEILIALLILGSALSASTLVAFGNQTILVESVNDRDALKYAETLLTSTNIKALADFRSITPIPPTTHGIFETSLEVTSLDFSTKEIKALVTWKNSYNLPQQITLSSLITDFQNNSEGDTCDPYLSGDWTHALIKNSVTAFKELVGDPLGHYIITDLDAYHDKLFVTANNSSEHKETFFIFDVIDPSNPTLILKFDNDLANATGLNAFALASTTDGLFAYTASQTSKQLHIIDLDSEPPETVAMYKIPGVTGATGFRIAYKNGYVYLGLDKTDTGPEFNIIDVHNPSAPLWVGGFQVGNQVNDMLISGSYAYLATPNDNELIILNITNPSHPVAVGGYDAPSTATTGSGKSIYLSRDNLYLGLTAIASHPEFYIIDASNPVNYAPTILGTKETGSSVNQLLVRDYIAYFLTTTGMLQMWNIATTSNIISFAPSIILPESSKGIALDCEKNALFVGSVPTSGAFVNQGFLSIISTP